MFWLKKREEPNFLPKRHFQLGARIDDEIAFSIFMQKHNSSRFFNLHISDLAENLGGSSEFQGLSNDTKLANTEY